MSQTLADLSIGSKVKFGKYQVNTEDTQPIIWTIVAKNHTGYPENSVTLHATEILDLRCFDAMEPNNSNSDRQSYGNNRYSLSNLDQWLNKNAAANAWYTAAHTADHSPDTSAGTGDYGTQYATRPGFLNGFTDDEKAAILSTTIRVVKPRVDGGSYEDVVRKVFLPSTTEVGLSNENNIAEGSAWGYYTSNSARIGYVTQQCFSNTPSRSKPSSKTTAWYWWLRTPYCSNANRAQIVHSDGSLNSFAASNGSGGVRPALNLSSSLFVSDSTDVDECYTIIYKSTGGSSIVINGVDYTNVSNINYIKDGTVQQLKKLVLNNTIVWEKSSTIISEGDTEIVTVGDGSIIGYSSVGLDSNGNIWGIGSSYDKNWESNYDAYKLQYPYVSYENPIVITANNIVTQGTYPFTLTDDGYYTSGNAGQKGSYSYGKLIFNFSTYTTITISCRSYGESSYDYGVISNLDQALLFQNSVSASESIFHSFKQEASNVFKTFSMVVPAGTHFITFKYIKDNSADAFDDNFKIKVTYKESTWYKIIEADSTSFTGNLLTA